jgi:AraC family transcriptional regulator, alkane utilization regulator
MPHPKVAACSNCTPAVAAKRPGSFAAIWHATAARRAPCSALCRRCCASRSATSHAAAGLADLLRVGVQESRAQRPGSQSLLAKLSELAFTEALRRYAQSNPPELKGWLAGLQDPYVVRALALLHGEPTRAWTVDQLAREVALSRSALAERFVATIGLPPMQYLTQWRLTLAAQTLRAGSESIARIAERSGYDSEAAFTRAFKREFGVPPTVWRKADTSGPAGAAAGRAASA